MQRTIFKELESWKNSNNRKVLLIRGARQVGKTYIVRELGKTFEHFLEVNFESEQEIKAFFDGNLNPVDICTKLSAYYSVPVIEGETLVFFDEIQACIPAIQSLRYFYEKLPGLHLIAAGSLLEFSLEQIPSFGVGRIRSLFLYPLSFNEFLLAAGQQGLLHIKNDASPANPLQEAFHRNLTEWFRKFIIIGGMPEAVKKFLEKKDILAAQTVLDDIINSLQDDFLKYKERISIPRLKDVFLSIMHQTGGKFNINSSSASGNHQQKKEALEMLEMAGLCYKVYHSSANGIPLAAERNAKKYKVLFFDTGILQRYLKVDISDFLISNEISTINKGNIAEQFVGLELIKYLFQSSRPDLHYWHREKHGSHAEVDYVIQLKNKILPIEVKSGSQGKMQSINIFIGQKKSDFGIRVSMENFSSYQNIFVFPVYAIDRLLSLIE